MVRPLLAGRRTTPARARKNVTDVTFPSPLLFFPCGVADQYKLVREALHERKIFLETAPYLSTMLP